MSDELLQVSDKPETILYNARIYTCDPLFKAAEAIAIRGTTICAIGSTAAVRALATADTKQFDVLGKRIIPGFCDAHIHMHEWSTNLTRPQLASARTKEEMLAQIATYSAGRPATSWIVCQGWNESWWGENQFFTAKELDAVTQPGQPAIAYRSDMHIAIANSAALIRAGITSSTPNPPGGIIDRDERNLPTGVLRELAIGLVTSCIPAPARAELVESTLNATAVLHRLGITAVHDQRIKNANEGASMLAVYTALRERGKLELRVNCNIAAHQLPSLAALGLRSGFGDEYLRLGHVKIFADGSLGSRTAWMIEPFAPESPVEPPNYGVVVTQPEQMAAEFFMAQQMGFPISIHAIGDRAIHVVLDLFEELGPQLPALSIPHRIEHVQTIDPNDIPRLAQLNITASVQPVHLTDDRDLSDRFLRNRVRYTYAFRSLLGAGTRLAFGSDAPVANPNPFLGIHAAFTRRRPSDSLPSWQPQEIIALPDILHAYTLGAAQAVGWESSIGSLTPGKRADLLILDRDIVRLAESPDTQDEIAEAMIMSTMFDGKFVYSSPTSPVA